MVLEVNNVRMTLLNGGDAWWDLVQNAKYEVPKGSGHNPIFSGGLWVGGTDVSGNIKLAAVQYRSNGVDYWSGPLNTTTAEIDGNTCSQYNQHWKISRNEIQQFINGDNTNNTINNWPAHGRNFAPYNEDFNLAPFFDNNSDGVYNPIDGDYPGFNISGANSLKGDEAVWWIINDKGNTHTETGSAAIGLEVRCISYAFATNDVLNNTTYYEYMLINRSSETLKNTIISQYIDADLGNPNDDYVGCDVTRGVGYVYNGGANDSEYGTNPPAIGAVLLDGPFANLDGLDNPQTDMINGFGYNDQIVDNERIGMSGFMILSNGGTSCCSDPTTSAGFYGYLQNIWKDGSHLIYGSTGHNTGSNNIETNYAFPADSDPTNWATGGVAVNPWSEKIIQSPPGDRRFLMNSGTFDFTAGGVQYYKFAVIYAEDQNLNGDAVEELLTTSDVVQAAFDDAFSNYTSNFVLSTEELNSRFNEINIFPNPINNSSL